MEKEFILGLDANEIVVGCVSTERGYFSFSVETYSLIDTEKYIDENARDYIIDILEEGIEDYISQLITYYFMDYNTIAQEIIDNMDESELLNFILPDIDYNVGEIEIEGIEYMLNLECCGQIDFREINNFEDKNKSFNDFIHKFWETYHLVGVKDIPKEEIELLELKLKDVEVFETEIEQYIIDNFDKIYRD